MRLVILLFFASVGSVLAQSPYELYPQRGPDWDIIKDGVLQSLAGTGGLNNPQVSTADLTGDGEDELYIFDRKGDVHLAFERTNSNASGWVYNHELTADWPKVDAFALLRDFNNDGVPDLFSHGIEEGLQGIKVHQGFRESSGRVSFTQVLFPDKPKNVLYYGDRGDDILMYCVISDIPAIEDLNGDGFLDVLSFDDAGGYIDHYINVGNGTGGASSFLSFERSSMCYGGVYETNTDGEVNLAPVAGACAQPRPPVKGEDDGLVARSGIHPGSTITAFDVDQDNDLDLLLGDVNTGFITNLTNTPDGSTAHFTAVDYAWPPNTTPVNIDNFPTVFPVGTGPGGEIEFLVAPSNPGGGSDVEVLWRYGDDEENPGNLTLLQRDFLTEYAFDHGTGAHAAFGDLNGDGIEDMLIGNDSYYAPGNTLTAELAYYEFSQGGYEEKNPAWLQQINAVVSPTLLGLHPVLVDMNADGRLDLILGSDQGFISYAENTTGSSTTTTFGNLIANWMNIDVGTLSAPAVADVTGDGLLDLVVGERRGKLAFFPNQGTANAPSFFSSASEDLYGGIDVRVPGFSQANPRPAFIEMDGQLTLYIGTAQGRMLVYNDLPDGPSGEATLVTELATGAGTDLSIAFGLDPQQNGFAVLGSSRGGLTFWRADGLVSSTDQAVANLADWSLSPNPTQNFATATNAPQGSVLFVQDLTGRTIQRIDADQTIGISTPGVYFITPVGNHSGTPVGRTKRLVVLD